MCVCVCVVCLGRGFLVIVTTQTISKIYYVSIYVSVYVCIPKYRNGFVCLCECVHVSEIKPSQQWGWQQMLGTPC